MIRLALPISTRGFLRGRLTDPRAARASRRSSKSRGKLPVPKIQKDYRSEALAIAEAVTSVPEPSTWAMLLIGFAGIGFMAYRKRCTVALA
jgi:PEP-CTERM motif